MLTDDDKKSAYERYGADGPQVEHHHRGHRRGHHGDFYDDDINPEDIFNMFFGGMPPGKYKLKHKHIPTGDPQTKTGWSRTERFGPGPKRSVEP